MSDFFFNCTATTEIYTYWHTLSLHVALPIWRDAPYLGRLARRGPTVRQGERSRRDAAALPAELPGPAGPLPARSPRRRWCTRGDPGPRPGHRARPRRGRSEEHTSELHSLMRISYAVFCLQNTNTHNDRGHHIS